MINKHLYILKLAALLFSSIPALAQNEQLQDPKPIGAPVIGIFTEEELRKGILFEDIIKRLPIAERKKMCNSLFADGIAVNISECWACVDNPSRILAAIMAQPEPFTSDMIGALERVFPQLVSHSERMRAGVLLYRYGRPVGRTYLEGRIKERMDLEAAFILAPQQDPALLPILLRMLDKYHSPELALAISSWKQPEIIVTLRNDAQKSVVVKKAGWLLNLLAFANTGAPDAVLLLRNVYKDLPLNESAKLTVAGTLLKLQPNNDDLVDFILQQQLLSDDKLPMTPGENEPDLYWRYEAIKAMGLSAHIKMAPKLIFIINDYVNKGDDTTYRVVEGPRRSEIAVVAIESLSISNSDNTLELAISLLKKLEKNLARGEYWERTARIIMEKQTKEGNQIVERIMGKRWFENELVLRKLMKVDANYLPISKFDPSQRFVDSNLIPDMPSWMKNK